MPVQWLTVRPQWAAGEKMCYPPLQAEWLAEINGLQDALRELQRTRTGECRRALVERVCCLWRVCVASVEH